jgi:hypothetical protein
MHTGAGEQRGEREVAGGQIEVQFITSPIVLMSFAALFHAEVVVV